jgi:hypothetical protein
MSEPIKEEIKTIDPSVISCEIPSNAEPGINYLKYNNNLSSQTNIQIFFLSKGDVFHVKAPDGRYFEVAVPDG